MREVLGPYSVPVKGLHRVPHSQSFPTKSQFKELLHQHLHRGTHREEEGGGLQQGCREEGRGQEEEPQMTTQLLKVFTSLVCWVGLVGFIGFRV